ncbi:TonB-dependent receptor [Sphingomonas lenta]|uniref:TonB-dependent receptor n=2 Tax=Sphingomonas lenta TaxID=1141887 RepID=A0A2A2SJ17_9SPHN|nr:TonB-dependent receptor [Sphingomonas lenta]
MLGASVAALSLGLAAPAHGQASTNLPDPAQSSSSSGNPNERGSAEEARADNAAVTGETTPAQDPTSTDATEGGDIIVTGFRAALENAVAEKKNRDQIVEAISAEDIGRLPDASIAESIARLPGLTSQRVNGRSNAISIRGFAPDFSTTLLNGREQTSTGDNRAVEYDQYPSEVVNQVLVYKTPMASLVGQGLSGTVDLRTIRPLEFGRRAFSIGARGTYVDLGKLNVESEEYGYRVNGTYVDQFADDTIGIALSASYLDEPYQIQEFNAWGYAGTGANGGPPYVIGGSKSYSTSTTLKRLGLQGTLQWRPDPQLTATLDAFFSDFEDDQIKRGIELPLGFNGNPLTNTTVQDIFVTAGTFANVEGVVRNDVFQRKAKLYSFGYNAKYEGDDGWNAMLDVSLSRTERNELTLETYSGTGRGQGVGATDTISFTSNENGTRFRPTLNYGDYNLIKLTGPLGWGGDQILPDGTGFRNGQDGYFNDRIIIDDLKQYRVEVEKEVEGFFRSFQVGVNYTDRLKDLTPDESFLYLTARNTGISDVIVPEQFRLGTTNLEYLGLGPVISYDPNALLDAGVYSRVRNPYGDVVVKSYRVEEKLMTGYFQANIDQELGSAQLTGNAGVQAIFTDQNSRGATAVFLGALPNGAPIIGSTPRNESVDYLDVLPSANLSLRTASDFIIRAGAAREIIRPRLDDMRASLSFGYNIQDPDGAGPALGLATVTGGSGNPELRPWRANAFDLTFEKYFGTNGFIAVQLFYKDLKSYIYNADIEIDTASIALPPPSVDAQGRVVPVAPTGFLNVPINGDGGELYGVELAGTLPFGTIVSALDGFGLTGGVSYTESKIKPSPDEEESALPGYSKWVANGTAFFEKYGFNIRGSVRYRSSFIGEVSGFAANRVRRRAAPELIVDGQIGYDFQDGSTLQGLSVFLQGQNLTDEPFRTSFPQDDRAAIDFQRYGRRFLAGFNFKF